ncbi:MAG: hypothetical protein FJ100_00445 [Deltaproteobacteria bacterium]|nr:hypothetical protein [Deltaproteobacteria bacterium]
MHQIGDIVDGYCPRCRLNTYQIVSATDGREVFSATCRTCRNTFQWRPELSMDELRENQVKKLKTMVRKRLKDQSAPSIITFASRKAKGAGEGGDLAMPLRAFREMMGRDPDLVPPIVGPQALMQAARAEQERAAAEAAAVGLIPASQGDAPGARWQRLTATLSARDGRPYNATRKYKPGDVLLHKSHGLGIVESIVHDNAAMVLFRDTQAVLEMGAPPRPLDR